MTNPTTDKYESIWQHLSRVPHRLGWVDAGGIRTRYIQAGAADAPALVMVHGTAGSLEAFCATLGAHAEHFNCLAFDLVGSGYSDKPDHDYEIDFYVEHTRNFMKAMGVRKCSLMGISMGTWVTARMAITHPAEVDRVTFLAPFGYSDDVEEIAGIRTRRGKAFDDPTWQNIKTIFDNLLYNENKRIPDLIATRQAMYQSPLARAAADHILNLFKPELLKRNLIPAEDWQRIQAPALVVLSIKDKPLFTNTARTVAKLIPKAQLFEMDNVGHWPQFEDPDLFNQRNLKFLLERN